MHEQQRERAHKRLQGNGMRHALFASAASVAWLTGFAPNVQVGPHPSLGGPPLLWYDDGAWTLVVARQSVADAERSGCAVLGYATSSVERPIVGAEQLATVLSDLVAPTIAAADAIGVEVRHLPAFLYTLLNDLLPPAGCLSAIDGWLVPLRMIKTDEEIAKLRKSFMLTDIGHRAAREAVAAGQREIDVWNAAHSAVQAAAGQRVAMGNDCVSGRRRANIGGWPGGLRLETGDSCLVDLGVIYDGYWSDSCATYYVDSPSERQRLMHNVVSEALALGASLLRPGAVAGDIDRQLRRFIADAGFAVYPHHSGHGVGVTSHEEPRIVPYSTTALEPGMIVLLEPGIYFPGETSCRLEHAYLINSDGAEQLTRHYIHL